MRLRSLKKKMKLTITVNKEILPFLTLLSVGGFVNLGVKLKLKPA